MSKVLLRARNLHKTYTMGRSKVRVLRGASLTAHRGEFLVVMGASGSGKSTLLHILGALDTPDRGSVEFEGRHLFGQSGYDRAAYRNRQIGFVFQFYHLLPELNVLENVMIPRFVGHSIWNWRRVRRAVQRDAEALLERVGLQGRAKHRPNELSGGERQRVAIARALVNEPRLLLADEPTGNLDETIGADIMVLLAELNQSGQTVVMVTHDATVASLGDRRLVLSEGVLAEGKRRGGGGSPAPAATTEITS